MKKIKFIPIILLGFLFTLSCEENNIISDVENSTNLVGFEVVNTSVTEIADGSEYAVQLKMKVFGPSQRDLTSDITVTVGVDESSSAVDGTHFRIDNNSITFKKSENYLNLFEFTMLTEGIMTPLESSPVLVLKATGASGDSKVMNSGKAINVTLNYACPSDLQGSYTCTMIRDGGAPVVYTDNITKTGVGTFRTSEVGHWIGGLGVGTPGYTFTDVCGVINVPQQDLVDYYGNQVQGTMPGTVDEETGVLHIVYSISSDAWSSVYDCTYVPN